MIHSIQGAAQRSTAEPPLSVTENGDDKASAVTNEPRLVAYIVPSSGSNPPDAAELHAFLKTKLPDYAIPSDFVLMDAIPRSANGKVSRSELPAPVPIAARESHGFVPPRNEVENMLAAIWSDVLGTPIVGIHDNFLEIGGDSILSIQIVAKARQAGLNLAPNHLFENPTIAELALCLEDWGSRWSYIVPIKPGGSKRPLFCVHSWEGNVLFYRDLGMLMDRDQPVYGLQAIGSYDETPPLSTIEEMAEEYLREIKTVQPDGPYALLSICFGNPIALEIACRLHARGDVVSPLVILDSGIRYIPPPMNLLRLLSVARKISDDRSTAHRIRRVGSYLHRVIRKMRNRMRRLTRYSWQHVRLKWDDTDQTTERFKLAQEKAWRMYIPPVFTGRITLIRSAEIAARRRFDWHVSRLTEHARDGVDVHVVPGDHRTILHEPYVQGLAACVTACLAEHADEQLTIPHARERS